MRRPLHARIGIALVVWIAMSTTLRAEGLKDVMTKYMDAIRELRPDGKPVDPAKLREFQKTWVVELSEGVAKAKSDDPVRASAIAEITALQSTLQDYKAALRSLELLGHDYPALKKDFMFHKNQFELLLADCTSDGFRNKETLERLSQLYDQAVTPDSILSVTPPAAFSFLSKYVDYLKATRDLEKIPNCIHLATGYVAALRLIPGRAGELTNRDNVYFIEGYFLKLANLAAKSLPAESRQTSLESILRTLFSCEVLATSKSNVLFQVSELLDPEHGKMFRGMVEDNLENLPVDAFTPKLKYFLAQSYLENSEPIKASKIFSELINSPVGLGASEKNPEVSPYASGILFGLAESLYQLGEKEEAGKLFQQFKATYPQDHRLTVIPSL